MLGKLKTLLFLIKLYSQQLLKHTSITSILLTVCSEKIEIAKALYNHTNNQNTKHDF